VKRRKLLQHLTGNACFVVREGARHTIVVNAATGARSEVPRHPEIKPTTVRGICKDLGIPAPTER
jgi:mRNA interferase HicA